MLWKINSTELKILDGSVRFSKIENRTDFRFSGRSYLRDRQTKTGRICTVTSYCAVNERKIYRCTDYRLIIGIGL